MKRVDACGFSCPEPVLRTMEQVNAGEGELEILVDTNVSKENVKRFLEDKGYKVEVTEKAEVFMIRGVK
ncbi:MAG: sulfurtransferase TusA family protein [Tissierellia bacterium]|nr:sulfurtransferase TusA family protein [Tissierellia bacterium]